MNNEPVGYYYAKACVDIRDCSEQMKRNGIPLYTHPVKEQKCVVQNCQNHKHEGSFNGDVCSPCYQFIVHGKGVHSQAYRNTHPAELTDEEIREVYRQTFGYTLDETKEALAFARAILRKAQEK